MTLFRIIRHGRGCSASYIKNVSTGDPLELTEDKADRYIDWLYKQNGKGSSLLVLEEVNEHTRSRSAPVGGSAA